MADLLSIFERAVSSLAKNNPENRHKIYEAATIAVVRQLEEINPKIPTELFQQQLSNLEAAIQQCELSYNEDELGTVTLLFDFDPKIHAVFSDCISNVPTATHTTKAMKRSAYLVELALPADISSDFVDSMEDIFLERWVPRYGLRRARWIWHRQCYGFIIRNWLERILLVAERVVKLKSGSS